MRIQGERPDTTVANSQSATEKARAARTEASTQAAKDRADRVEVSDDARLLSAAVQAAKSAPETSDAAVERARQKLVSGELGRDAERLADKLIDHLLR
jgi:flagellar biosynthesis anti-sigma factor FlgM